MTTTVACVAAGLLSASAGAADTVLIAPQIVMPDGSLASDRAVVIADDGTIRSVISVDDVPADATIVRYESGVISPGLVDVNSYLGVNGSNYEQAEAIDPNASALDAFDPGAVDVARAHRAGVTTAMIAPAPLNVIAGRFATVRTWSATTEADVLAAEAGLSLVLSDSAYSANREPSSRAGAMQLLRSALSDKDRMAPPIAAASIGALPVLVTCDGAQDVFSAITLLGTRGMKPVIIHSIDAGSVAADVAEAETTMIVGPYDFGSDATTLAGAAALEAAGATVVLSGQVGVGDPDRLRIGAALAVRHGLSPEAARRAITSAAADVANVGDVTGAIRQGLAADLVVFSGDPLRLDARVIDVWIAGERTYSATSAQYNHDKVIGATHEK